MNWVRPRACADEAARGWNQLSPDQAALAARGNAVHGILNGVDYEEWDPAHDKHLPIHFGPATIANKAELKRNYSQHAHNTQRAQELSAREKELEPQIRQYCADILDHFDCHAQRRRQRHHCV